MDKQVTSIKVGPFDYDIRWYNREEENRDTRYGYTDNNELQIGLSDRLAPARKADTFIHEALHSIWYVLGMKDRLSEEEVISKLATGLTMLARDNPETMRWWIDLTNAQNQNKLTNENIDISRASTDKRLPGGRSRNKTA